MIEDWNAHLPDCPNQPIAQHRIPALRRRRERRKGPDPQALLRREDCLNAAKRDAGHREVLVVCPTLLFGARLPRPRRPCGTTLPSDHLVLYNAAAERRRVFFAA